tara:strand:- start:24830 stop:29548 length:4719 start_codon:yes stop_codon:yes gene_type:complete
MFYGNSVFNQPLNNLDVSKVTNMDGVFVGAFAFNQDIGSWDVSSVTSMDSMFENATSFNNGPVISLSGSEIEYVSPNYYSSSNLGKIVRNSTSNENYALNDQMFYSNITYPNDSILTFTNTNTATDGYMVCGLININPSLLFVSGASNSQFYNILRDAKHGNYSDLEALCAVLQPNSNRQLRIWDNGTSSTNTNSINLGNNARMETDSVISIKLNSAGGFTVTNDGAGTASPTHNTWSYDSEWTDSSWTGNWYIFGCISRESSDPGILFDNGISNWNVSKVTTMHEMFKLANAFNQPIGSWDVSKVSNMDRMFNDASNFNQDIGSWDVSSLISMERMFGNAVVFNQALDSWNVSKVENMSLVFRTANSFNQPLGSWDMSSVTEMYHMFSGGCPFDQDISGWDVSKVENISHIFSENSKFNQDISGWDVSSVTNMEYTFYGATAFNQDISNWDVSQVSNMNEMFNGASNFNQPLGEKNIFGTGDELPADFGNMAHDLFGVGGSSNWYSCSIDSWGLMDDGTILLYNRTFDTHGRFCRIDLSGDRVTDAARYREHELPTYNSLTELVNGYNTAPSLQNYVNFTAGTGFNNITFTNGWDVSKVTNMNEMFKLATAFNQPIGSWDVSKVSNMERMFWFAEVFNQDISNWDVSQVSNMNKMFDSADAFNQPLGGNNFGTGDDLPADFGSMTIPVHNVTCSVDRWAYYEPNKIIIYNYTEGSHGRFALITMNGTYENNSSRLIEQGGSTVYNTRDELIDGYTTATAGTYSNEHSFESGTGFYNITGWDVSSVTTMEHMFMNAESFNQDISNWNLPTSGVDYTDYGLGSGHSDNSFVESSIYYFKVNSYSINVSTTVPTDAEESANTGNSSSSIFVSIFGHVLGHQQSSFHQQASFSRTPPSEIALGGWWLTGGSSGVPRYYAKNTSDETTTFVRYVLTDSNGEVGATHGIAFYVDTNNDLILDTEWEEGGTETPYNLKVNGGAAVSSSVVQAGDAIELIGAGTFVEATLTVPSELSTTQDYEVILENELLFTSIDKGETLSKTFEIAQTQSASHENIVVKMYNTSGDGVWFKNVTITFNTTEYVFTTVDNIYDATYDASLGSRVGTFNTVGWLDEGDATRPAIRYYTNIFNTSKSTINVSTTADSTDNADTLATIYVSFLTTEGNNILVEQELFTGLNKNETKTETFSLPAIYDNIQVQIYTTNTDAVALSEVEITYNNNIHLFTTVDNNINSIEPRTKLSSNAGAGGYSCSASSVNSGSTTSQPFEPFMAFEGNSSPAANTWVTAVGSYLGSGVYDGSNSIVTTTGTASGEYIILNMPHALKLSAVKLAGQYTTATPPRISAPKNWSVYGKNSGNWELIQQFTNSVPGNGFSTYNLTTPSTTAYQSFAILVTESNGDTIVCISEIEFVVISDDDVGINNTVGWFDFGTGADNPHTRYYTNISNSYTINVSTTADSIDYAETVATIYVSFLTTEGNNILVDQELFTGLNKNETKTGTFSLPALYDNIQVQIHATEPDGVVFSEVKITYNDVIHIFTNVDNTYNDGNGVNNTVGWLDGNPEEELIPYPYTRTYTNISNS